MMLNSILLMMGGPGPASGGGSTISLLLFFILFLVLVVWPLVLFVKMTADVKRIRLILENQMRMGSDTIKCTNCGNTIAKSMETCPFCGKPPIVTDISERFKK